MKKGNLIGIAVLFLVISIGIVFVLQKGNKNLSIKQGQNQTQYSKEQSISTQPKETIESQLVWYEIPELGVKFKVKSNIASELVYRYKGESSKDSWTISFSTKKLSLVDGCGAASSDAPLGLLVKIKGIPENYSERDYFLNGRQIKQFDGYFIIQNGPQAFCAIDKDNIVIVERYFEENPEFRNWSDGIFDTMEKI